MRYLNQPTKVLAALAFVVTIGVATIQPIMAATTPIVLAPAQISDEEAAGLIFMVEEEKLAHDLYTAFSAQWSLRIFTNIANAEETHMNAVRNLLNLYGLDDPTVGQPAGVFQDPTLQALYDELLVQGSASLIAALNVGITVEEVDIADLDKRIAQTDEPAILQVYGNLRTGSTHHLQAYTRTLARYSSANN